jgi:hypothetical protein
MIDPVRNIVRSSLVLLLAAVAAGCSTSTPKPAPIADPNVFPSDYKGQIATFLSTVLLDRGDFTNAQIGAPVLEQVGATQHYVVCVLFNTRSEHREKVVVYLANTINQVIDAQPGQCASAAYQPFAELAALLPHK